MYYSEPLCHSTIQSSISHSWPQVLFLVLQLKIPLWPFPISPIDQHYKMCACQTADRTP